jgi:hypothetical protein
MSPEYLRYLVERHEEEACGELFFNALFSHTNDRANRYKWKVATQLECETRERIAIALDAAGITPEVRDEKLREAETHGVRLAQMPWDELMVHLRPAIQRAVDAFERAETLAGTDGQASALLRRITRHEKAYLEFVDRELEGRVDSLAPILAVVDRVPRSVGGSGESK